MSPQTVSNFTIVDFTKENLKPNTAAWTQACIDVRHSLEEYGFFVARCDQVASEHHKQVFDSMKELFDLPTEAKSRNRGDLFNPYVGLPFYESTGITDVTNPEEVQKFTDLMWPSGNKQFCDVTLSYAKFVAELEKTADRMVFESYGAQKHLEKHVDSTLYLLEHFKFGKPQEDTSSGKEVEVDSNLHTDKSFLTIFYQNNVNAHVQIQARNGEWIDVDYPLDTFVVMAGDAYEIWSNGRIHSPRHRGIMKGEETEYTLVLKSFNKGKIEVPEELVDKEHPLQFKPFDQFEMFKYSLAWNGDKTSSIAKAYCGITV